MRYGFDGSVVRPASDRLDGDHRFAHALWIRAAGRHRAQDSQRRRFDYSDTRPEWTYGGGYLWIFDAEAPRHAEVLGVSESTGAVLARVAMPDTERVDLAAGAAGLWVGLTLESGWPIGQSPSAYGLLYFVGVHAAHPIVAPSVPNVAGRPAVQWLAAQGTAAWADIWPRAGGREQRFESFPSPTTRASVVTAGVGEEPTDFGEGAADAPPVIVVPQVGLVTVLPGLDGGVYPDTSTQQSVVALRAASGGRQRLASFHLDAPASLVADTYYDGALYLLLRTSPSTGATIVRIQM